MFTSSSTIQKMWSEFVNVAQEGQLSAREKAIVNLVCAALLTNRDLFTQHLLDAKLQGLTNDDVSQIVALVISHHGTTMLATLGNDGDDDESCCQ